MEKIEGVIFDWAGTTVDYGCFAPVEVFLKVFEHKGVAITLDEARGPMGMLKIDHIRALTQVPRIAGEWEKLYGKMPGEEDVNAMYAEFEPSLLSILTEYATPNPEVLDTVAVLRKRGLKIGSTTGYTNSMMDILVPEAAKQGYSPDCYVTPDGLPAGRPFPWMCYQNAIQLGIYPMSHIVKVGDTISDIKEGVNAGCFSVGVVLGSNEMGLHKAETDALPAEELEEKIKEVSERFYAAGANAVIRSMDKLPALIDQIDALLPERKFPFSLTK